MEQAHSTLDQDVISTWIFWVEAIDKPNASELVTGINVAHVSLNQILKHGFPQDEMEQWLQQWPTELGMVQFRRTGRIVGSAVSDTAASAPTLHGSGPAPALLPP